MPQERQNQKQSHKAKTHLPQRAQRTQRNRGSGIAARDRFIRRISSSVLCVLRGEWFWGWFLLRAKSTIACANEDSKQKTAETAEKEHRLCWAGYTATRAKARRRCGAPSLQITNSENRSISS